MYAFSKTAAALWFSFRAKVFKIAKQGQGKLVIRVVEGESERPEACIQIGACTVDAQTLGAGTPVSVSYCYQSNGQLEVRAQVAGQEGGVNAVFQRENSMSTEQLQLWSQCFAADA